MQAKKVNQGHEIFKNGILLFATLSHKIPNYAGFIKGCFKNEIIKVPYSSARTFW
jgi:HSP90 family molecular chaperone